MTFNPISQSEAVVSATTAVLGDRYDPSVPVRDVVTDKDRAAIRAMLIEGFKAGTIRLSDRVNVNDDRELGTYVSGLISNWFKKSPKLNGGGKYTPSSQSPRSSSQVKAVMSLRAECEAKGNTEGVKQCDAYLAKLQAEAEAKKKAIDVSKIPPELRDLLSVA